MRRFAFIGWRWIAAFTMITAADPARNEAAAEALTNLSSQSGKEGLFPVLRTAEQIHLLTREEAAQGHRALIRGVVTCSLPQSEAVVLQDLTRGIYIDRLSVSLGEPPRIGELLEIDGVTDPGEFAPQLHAFRMTRLGMGELPQPARPAWDQLINGSLDTQYVEVQGIVTAVGADGFKLLTHGGKLKVLLTGTNTETLSQCENSLVRLRGCLFASWDAATHRVRVSEIRLHAPSVTIEEPAPKDLFTLASKRARDLLLFDAQASALRRVKVSGQVIHETAGEYFLMDGANGLRFNLKEPVELRSGDLVEVVGFPSLNGPSPILQEAVARKTGSAALPRAKKVLPDNLFHGEHDSTLVLVEATLVNLSGTETGQTLELQAGLRRFIARLDSGGAQEYTSRSLRAQRAGVRGTPIGSRLEVSGAYAGRGGNLAAGRDIDSFELLVNSSSDIRVLSRPPWWTLRRVLWVLSGLCLVLVAVMVWVLTLRRRVNAQTEIIRQKVQRETVLEERTRIAREFHDTLEQALVGIGMQLDAAANIVGQASRLTRGHPTFEGTNESEPPEAALDRPAWPGAGMAFESLQILNIARAMVRHSHEEARRSVWNLRTYSLERGDLPAALSEMKGQVKNGSPVRIDFEISGTPSPLPSRIEGHLLRIGQEATTNAIKHAQCKTIRLELRYEPKSVQLSIQDDGFGFDAENATSSEAGHFGLLGMRERAEKIGGVLTVLSTPGTGTRINVSVPLTAASPHLG